MRNILYIQRFLSKALLSCGLLGSLALNACQGQAFTYEGNQDVALSLGSSTQPSSVVDILFVVDNSGSMADKQATLRASTASFINTLAKSNVDYHLGVVTTDLYAASDGGRLRMAAGGPSYLSAPTPGDPQAASKQQANIGSFMATINALGTGGSSQESALGATLMALAPPSNPLVKAAAQAQNTGFLRSNASLAVVIVTDEDDCTPLPQNFATIGAWSEPANCYTMQEDLQQVPALVQQFAQLKGDISQVRVALITGGVKGSDGSFTPKACNVGNDGQPDSSCGCWYYAADAWFCTDLNTSFGQSCTSIGTCAAESCPATAAANVCDTPRCTTTAPHRYLAFLNAFAAQRQSAGLSAGTYVDSICQSDYQNALLSVAQNVVISNCFTLSPGTDMNQLSVSVAHQLANGSYSSSQVVQRYGSQDPFAACTQCGNCPNNAWQLNSGNSATPQICLACGTQSLPGDRFTIGD